MKSQYLNLTALIALVGAGACLLGEISYPTAAPATPLPPTAAAPATPAQKAEGACPACRQKATAAAPNACPYVAARTANKSGCSNCGAAAKAAAGTR